ncbi:response regulator [Litorisediminicola beolgyonensis]|uniref:Response regulator n=1 Tax=Litorisediminicola beolgyonensis TaxID=1173614 RepID=A0ABW3ZJD5_9RHOB
MQALIVEDNPGLAFLWSETLEDAGFACDSVDDCESAMPLVLRKRYDVVILDLIVKDGNTLSLSDWISMRSPDTAVIMLTGAAVFRNGEHTTEASGVDWFLRKPVPPSDLRAMALYLSERKTDGARVATA